MREVGSIPGSVKTTITACAIIVMGYLLAPMGSDRHIGPVPSLMVDNGSVVFKTSPISAHDRDAIRLTIATFVWELSNEEVMAVPHVAPELNQAQSTPRQATDTSLVSACTALTSAKTLTFDSMRMSNRGPVMHAYVEDELGQQWQASFALSGGDGGEWKVVGCWADPAPGELV